MNRIGAGALVLLCGLTPATAVAHAYLVASDPPHRAVLDAAPAAIRLQFSEPVEAAFAKLDLRCEGKPAAGALKGSASRDRRTLTAALPAELAGECLLAWSIVARDGHRTRGELSFRVRGR